MENKIIIRKAEPRDLTAIVEMARAMADYHHSLDAYYKTSASYKNLEEDLAEEFEDKDSALLIAEEDRKIIGYFRGMIEPAPMYLAPKKIGVVYDLFIKPEYRGKGVGKKIFQAALGWFQDRNVKNIELNVDARNEPGKNFWKQHGFSEYKIRMRLDLKEE